MSTRAVRRGAHKASRAAAIMSTLAAGGGTSVSPFRTTSQRLSSSPSPSSIHSRLFSTAGPTAVSPPPPPPLPPPSSDRLSPPSSASSSFSLRLSLGALAAAAMAALTIGVYQSSLVWSEAPPVPPSSGGLDPKAFQPLKLKRVHRYNHNTAVYTFALPDPNAFLNLPVSSCIMTRFKDEEGKEVIRPYTPVDTHRKGELVLLIKTYPEGRMSQRVAHLKPGETLDVKGPVPKLKYEPNMKKKIGMIAGGTGITPMLQVLEEISAHKEDKSKVHLLFANISPADILMKETLDALMQKNPNFKVTYIVDSRDKDWKGDVGRIDKNFIKRVVPFSPQDGSDLLIYVCGPPEMMKAISGEKAKDFSQGELTGALKELGFSKDQVYKF